MLRQAATLLKSQTPLIASGIEKSLFDNSPLVVRVQEKGEVDGLYVLKWLQLRRCDRVERKSKKKYLAHLDEQGIVKTEEELILMKILGKRPQKFVNASLYLPTEERGIVYQVKKKQFPKNQKEIELVEIYVVHERKIEVGDKLTTRFGNKGVVAKIVPESQMPFDEEGKTIDIIFNPLGVPTRMNSGQLLEVILASAARKLDTKLLVRPFNTLSLEAIKSISQEAGIKNFGSQKLFDGQTGLPFQQEIYNGYIYVLKLNHMVTDKFHARNTGSYSLLYQQPLKGRSRGGGQRVGEMEVGDMQAHGASYNLMEMMGPKSDDIYKRRLMRNSLYFDNRQIDLRSNNRGLFDPRIFGPYLNYECHCGKYKGKQNEGQICERCETLIALFKVLATDLSNILKISVKDLEDIIYLRSYIVVDNGLTKIIADKQLSDEIITQAQQLIEGLVQEDNPDNSETKSVFLEDYQDFLENESLLQKLSGKEGILRRYSLGKRVDYSARSVIVPNPTLQLEQVGLPDKIVFFWLDKIIQNHPVLVNRAPSLHRLSIQAFYPQLTLGNSIELHPLVTTALNADFDGDQVAIYLPLTKQCQKEAKELMLSPQHIIDPKNGYLIDNPTQDMILGIYYLTKEKKGKNLVYYDEINNI
ncbi:hypothetical protein C1645_819512 [Glomus cerebriforme]|uniref:Bifunctional DNA-directed RNA polymerase subunit beta-beta' n=1 Tax=Glomus cerebriforme TaxID=658196 RepID=A0A397TA91_9GLOM|nr:hypothetical protein C1645_819512 [Glomus cerebriforme]